MRVLIGRDWQDGYIDEFRAPSHNRVRVLAMVNLERLEGMYFIRPRSLRLVANYLREIGFRQLVRKVRSRMQEAGRNEKFLSCGYGVVLEPSSGGLFEAGQDVIFLAPCHPPCLERIVLPDALMGAPRGTIPLDRSRKGILHVPLPSTPPLDRWWEPLLAYSSYSGVPFPADAARRALAEAEPLLAREPWPEASSLPTGGAAGPAVAAEVIPAAFPATRKKPRGVVFGFGNYTKTLLIPNVSPHITIDGIHEIDPTQIDRTMTANRWDTSPFPRAGERADVFFAAGYHHTHVPVALQALKQGSYAVVEKPVATTDDQLAELLTVLATSGPKLFSCFHKRFLPFNRLAWEDLAAPPGTPISYSCLVYEVPLPPRHWYRWPNSCSRLVSNGCHWLDHFLFLNRYPEVDWYDLVIGPDQTLNVSVRCANGAFFTMLLTDQGSERIGLRDYVELRRPGATVRMTDGGAYRAENGTRILREARINKLSSHGDMYKEIARRIAMGEPGDSLDSVRISAGLVLNLERLFREKSRIEPEKRHTTQS